MKILLKKAFRKCGVEVRKYSPDTSEAARIQRLLTFHNIDLVLDVGANVGQYAKYLREIGYAGKIVSFEPLSSAYSQLVAASRKDPLWEIAPRAAIGDRNGEIKINISKNSFSSSVLPMLDSHLSSAPESAYIATEKVKLCKLDTVAPIYIGDTPHSVYLKIDVQGFELKVLEGAVRILPKILGIQLELSLIPLYDGGILFSEMIDKMEQAGYELHAVIPGFTDVKSGRMLQMDGIFIKHE
jgi:FkbM family methyltransferase